MAIQALLEALEGGLIGSLPKAYYLSAIDPGVGKTLSVTTFLRTWKAQGFKPASSVLIGLSRLQEIDAYLEGAGLEKNDIAVLTSDQELNRRLGVAVECHGTARVMFTTQQMIERRTRDRTFTQATEFHFKGRPRSLRIWDESLVPAERLVVGADDVGALPALLSFKSPAQAAAARTFASKLWASEDRTLVTVPDEFANLSGGFGRTSGPLSEAMDTLSRLAGQQATLIEVGQGDMKLAGSARPLPADFAPVVILDASGRVRTTYDVWERKLGTLRRLPAVANDYDRLRVHLWERPVGQRSFQKPGTMVEVVDAVAEAVNEDPTSDWLIVSYKSYPVEEALRAEVTEAARPRLNFLTWGRHHGTNAFAHCKNVVLIGQLTYSSAGYVALASAAGHAPTGDTEGVEQELKAGEYRDGYLQALTRASVRRSRNGVAGVCTAFVIASPGIAARNLLSDTFPGCTIEPWTPSLRNTRGRAAELIGLLEQAAHDKPPSLRKGELAATLGMKGSHFSRLLKHPDVVSYIERKNLWVRQSEISGWPTFSPYADGGFIIEDLEHA